MFSVSVDKMGKLTGKAMYEMSDGGKAFVEKTRELVGMAELRKGEPLTLEGAVKVARIIADQLKEYLEEETERPLGVYGWFAGAVASLAEDARGDFVKLGALIGMIAAGLGRDLVFRARGSYPGEVACLGMLEAVNNILETESMQLHRALVRGCSEVERFSLELRSRDVNTPFFEMNHYFFERVQPLFAVSKQLELLGSNLRAFAEAFEKDASLPEEMLRKVVEAADRVCKLREVK